MAKKKKKEEKSVKDKLNDFLGEAFPEVGPIGVKAEQSDGRTREETRQLALDIVQGKVFHDRCFGSEIGSEQWARDVRMVFLPIALMDPEHGAAMAASNPQLIFEYFDKAGPRSVNGYPQFFSVQTVPASEWDLLCDFMEKFQAAEEAVK
jgi:hypothetical protein